MPRPRNNSFANDTIALRRVRLSMIESQSSTTLALFSSLPDDIRLWMSTCHTEYNALLAKLNVQAGDTKASNERLRLARATLRRELGYAKAFIRSSYHADEVRLRAFDLERTLPRKDAAMLELAQQIVRVAETHKQEGVDYRLPDSQLQRFAEATEAFAQSRELRGDSKSNKGSSHAAEDVRYQEDTQRLRRLLALWQGNYGTDDVRVKMLGMVNSKSGGNSARPGVLQLSYDAELRLISCQPDEKRPAPTSYHLQYRKLGSKEWKEYRKSASASFSLMQPLEPGNSYELRARARNSNGCGKWSAIIEMRDE